MCVSHTFICRENVSKTTHQTVNSGADCSKERAEWDFHIQSIIYLCHVYILATSKCHIPNNKNNKGFKHHLNSGAGVL